MEEISAGGVEFLQLFAAALRHDDVAQVAIGGNDLLAIVRCVVAVMASETAGGKFMADVVRMDAPVRLHFRKEVLLVNFRGCGNNPVNAGLLGVNGMQA